VDRSPIAVAHSARSGVALRRYLPIVALALLTMVASIPGFVLHMHAQARSVERAPGSDAQVFRAEAADIAASAAVLNARHRRPLIANQSVDGTRLTLTIDSRVWRGLSDLQLVAVRRTIDDAFAATYRQNHLDGYVGDQLTIEFVDSSGRIVDVERILP